MRTRISLLLLVTASLAVAGGVVVGQAPPGTTAAPVEERVRNLNAQVVGAKQGVATIDDKLTGLERQLKELREKVFSVEAPKPPMEKTEPEVEEKLQPQKVKYRPPLYVRKIASIFLVCKEGRVTVVDLTRIKELVKAAQPLSIGKAIPGETGDYDLSFSGFRLDAALKPGRTGETAEQVRNPNSTVASYLKKVNAKAEVLAFKVYPDSFEVYRVVRDMAWDRSLETQWDVLNVGDKLQI